MAMKRTQGRTGCGLVRACLTACGMASQMPGSRMKKTLTLLGLIVLIIHCRPWSYALFEQVSEGEHDAEDARGEHDLVDLVAWNTHVVVAWPKKSRHVT